MKIYTDEEITKKLNRRKTRKKVVSIILYPIIALILVCNIALILQVFINPEETPNLFGYEAFSVASGSMEPTLDVGDIVVIKKSRQEDIKKGDIITFKEKDSVITHRLVEIIKENGDIFYQTKGDNNNAVDDKLINYEDIEGIYVFRIPKLGKVVNNAQNTTAIVSIVLVLYLIYKILQIKDDRNIARHEKRKEIEEKKKEDK